MSTFALRKYFEFSVSNFENIQVTYFSFHSIVKTIQIRAVEIDSAESCLARECQQNSMLVGGDDDLIKCTSSLFLVLTLHPA